MGIFSIVGGPYTHILGKFYRDHSPCSADCEGISPNISERFRFRNCIYHGPPKPTFLEVFIVNHLVFRLPKPLVFTVLGAILPSSWGTVRSPPKI